jgi:hypothetical protein
LEKFLELADEAGAKLCGSGHGESVSEMFQETDQRMVKSGAVMVFC